jgi:putative membrane protein
MHQRVRDNVTSLTAVLTIVSLALVFGAVGRVLPAGTLPRAPAVVFDAIPHVNAAISLLAIGAIAAGIRAIKRSNVVEHRRRMLASFVLFATFLVLYLYKVAIEGPTPFPGEGSVETFVYLPILAVHVLLAIVCLPLVYYVLLVAYSYPIHELSTTAHPRVGRVAASLWLISFFLGEVVYVMLYWWY